jgi:hypothetical protein
MHKKIIASPIRITKCSGCGKWQHEGKDRITDKWEPKETMPDTTEVSDGWMEACLDKYLLENGLKI